MIVAEASPHSAGNRGYDHQRAGNGSRINRFTLWKFDKVIFDPSGERCGQIVDGAVAGVSLNPPTCYVHGGGEVDLELGTESSMIVQFSNYQWLCIMKQKLRKRKS